MSKHAYCYLMSFLGALGAIGLVSCIAYVKAAFDEFCRSDYSREVRNRATRP